MAQLIGAQQDHSRLLQPGQGLLVGMAVGIVRAYGDDAVGGHHRVQEAVAGGGVGAVVAHLQHIRLPIHTAAPIVQHVVFRLGLHIPGKQE